MAANDGRVLRSDGASPVGTVVSAASTLVDVHSIRPLVSNDLPRWNDWSRVYPVQFDNEQVSQPRGVRLACPAMRKGDPVQIIDGPRTTTGVIAGIVSSVVNARTMQTTRGD